MLIIFDHICWQCQPSLYLFHTTTHLTWQIENQIEHPMTDLIMRPRKRHNVFDDIMKMTASMEMRLDDILARVSGGRSKSSRMRCTLPRPFTSYSLEPSVPSSPCWQSTSRCFSPKFSIWQLKLDLPGPGHGRCSMRVPDWSSADHWVPCHTILAWYLWQVPFLIQTVRYTNTVPGQVSLL